MAYSYGFDDDSPRFELRTLWFLLGVLVFAFSVLAMTAIVTTENDRGYYLNVQQQPAQQTKPATTNRGPVVAETTNSTNTTAPPRRTR